MEHNFAVCKENLSTYWGECKTHKAVVRHDTGQIIGVVGKNYRLITHADVLNRVKKAIPDLENERITTCRNGAVMFAKYSTPILKSVEVQKGDIVSFGLEVFNSYDMSMPVGFQFVAKRLVCLNGMTIPKSIAYISVKHTNRANFGDIQDEFASRIPLISSTSDRWGEWTKTTPPEYKVETFLKTYAGKQLKDLFHERYTTSQDKSVWALFNILTHYSTHLLKVRKKQEENRRLSQLAFDRRLTNHFYNYDWR